MGHWPGAIQEIPDTALSKNQIAELYAQTDPSQHPVLDELLASYTAGLKVKGTYKGTKDAFDAVEALDEVSGSITAISDALRDIAEK